MRCFCARLWTFCWAIVIPTMPMFDAISEIGEITPLIKMDVCIENSIDIKCLFCLPFCDQHKGAIIQVFREFNRMFSKITNTLIWGKIEGKLLHSQCLDQLGNSQVACISNMSIMHPFTTAYLEEVFMTKILYFLIIFRIRYHYIRYIWKM